MGYVVGTSEGTWNDPEGNRVTSQEKWVAVYKKQPDGTWKCVVDIWNSDQPAPPPAAE
jgi:ketosteroid isomerase-like protein